MWSLFAVWANIINNILRFKKYHSLIEQSVIYKIKLFLLLNSMPSIDNRVDVRKNMLSWSKLRDNIMDTFWCMAPLSHYKNVASMCLAELLRHSFG